MESANSVTAPVFVCVCVCVYVNEAAAGSDWLTEETKTNNQKTHEAAVEVSLVSADLL